MRRGTLAGVLTITELLRRQHGLITRAQAVKLGLSNEVIDGRVGRTWEPVYRGVFRELVVEPTWEQSVMAACLAAGPGRAWASGETAARLLGLDGCEGSKVEVTTTGKSRSRPGMNVRHVREMPRCDRMRVKGIPCTTASRTLLDLGASMPLEGVELAVESALRRRLTSTKHLRSRLDVVGGRGRAGSRALRRVLEIRDEEAAAESALETQFLQALRTEGLPPPVRQLQIFDGGRFLIRIDFAYPDVRLAIELDGFLYHGRREKWEQDHARRSRLPALGWRLIVVTKRQLQDNTIQVVTNVAQAAAMRLF